MMQFPLRHLSVRVPWHDNSWNGTICNAPHLNGACVKLKGISGTRDDEFELAHAGESLETLPHNNWPSCVNERATFMAPFEMDQIKRHALSIGGSQHYRHFLPTAQRYPAFSAGVVPFFWMMRDNLENFGEALGLDVDISREPELGYRSNWVHEAGNQKALLDGFASHLVPQESLCLFYAKHAPFLESTGRALIGVGRVTSIGPLSEYDRSGEGMPGMIWERPIQHSIRPSGTDGFLMPYQEVINRAQQDPDLDIERYIAHAPTEHWNEFSYGSELVTHDGGISALLSIEAALERTQDELGIETRRHRSWLHEELARLWKIRGPYPGLGVILAAFGITRGVFVAHFLQDRAGQNADPWPLVDEAFRNPDSLLPPELRRDIPELAKIWKSLPEGRRKYLRLLSRFDLTFEQATALYDDASRSGNGWRVPDSELISNPYRLYEITRHHRDGVQLLTIDRGVFPADEVRLAHPLDAPSGLESALDPRRIRAFVVASMEQEALKGHTLSFRQDVTTAVRQMTAHPSCPITLDVLHATDLSPEIVSVETGGQIALQLTRYKSIGDVIRKQINGRIQGQRHAIEKDWRGLLDENFGGSSDNDEQRARQEKAAALKELAQSRFSVLIGPAGAGKTSVLGILCEQPEIRQAGILLLAPTGKARVRMQELAGDTQTRALTIAQFLNQYGRYDGVSNRYHLSDRPKATGFATVIIDEASMITEDMLGAVLDALQGAARLILVGDPAQLPPIGAGRPFVDIVSRLRPEDNDLRFPRVSQGYAELTIERRQLGTDCPDLRLARWFSASSPAAGDDDIFTASDEAGSRIRFVQWDQPESFAGRFMEVLAEELKLDGSDDQRGFNRAMGATASGDYDYFNATRNDAAGAVASVEAWQVLSPLRSSAFGVSDINRAIQQKLRADFIEFASRDWNRSIPKPLGNERIVYGSKVINLSNHRRDGKRVYPKDGALGYLANGEIGVVVGQWNTNKNPKILKVEFSSQPGYRYDFYKNDFRDEGEAALELAYALTVHKAQGSQFRLVILVLPEAHPILSRELVYTALTRHQDRIVILHQGPRSLLKEFAAPHKSAIASRRTNLLSDCRMLELPLPKGSVFLQEGLIHRTSKGLPVRSKSELLIAEALTSSGVTFSYEKPLTMGGQTRYPDFTIEDDISGLTIYWEHLGMLEREEYRTRWEKKRAWYLANGVCEPHARKDGLPILLTTVDSAAQGLDMAEVHRLVKEVCSG